MPCRERLQFVINALREKKDREQQQKILHKLFNGHGSTWDSSGMMFVDGHMDVFPTARIILNQRALGEVWVASEQFAAISPPQDVSGKLFAHQDGPAVLVGNL